MDKLYGYKEEDVISLIEEINSRGNKPLSTLFLEYSLKHNKAKGTVRNMYYAIAKRSLESKEFCDKYLNGTPILVDKIVEFNDVEERELLKRILEGKAEGRSIRSVILSIAGNDTKLALRLQNKYRNEVKTNKPLILDIINEINADGEKIKQETLYEKKSTVSEFQLKRLKNEIDKLVLKISGKLRKENEFLRERITALELENIKLNSILYGSSKPSDTIGYFLNKPKTRVIH